MLENKVLLEITDLIKNHFGRSVQEIGETIKKNSMVTEDNFNAEAFNEGRESCKLHDGDIEKTENPYKKPSGEFYSWNKGWNSILFNQ